MNLVLAVKLMCALFELYIKYFIYVHAYVKCSKDTNTMNANKPLAVKEFLQTRGSQTANTAMAHLLYCTKSSAFLIVSCY